MSEEFKTKSPKSNARLKHIDRFISLYCAADLMTARFFPNAKEISESMAAVVAAEKHLCDGKLSKFKDNVAVACIGDGFTPRTAALFAFMTKWDCFSIDPNLSGVHGNTYFYGIRTERLRVIGEKVEYCGLDLTSYDYVILVGVHSHASNRSILDGINFRVASTIMMPCCVHQPPFSRDYITYEDDAVWSPHNKITVSYNVAPQYKGHRRELKGLQ